jgi:hypothetical protein
MEVRLLVVALAAVSLAACGSQHPRGLSGETLETIHNEGLHLKDPADVEFSTRTKGEVVGSAAFGIGAALLGGGNSVVIDTGYAKPRNGYLDASAWTLSLDSEESDSFRSPVVAMSTSIEGRLSRNGIPSNPDATYSLVSSGSWGLDYEKLTEADNYRVYFRLYLSLKRGIFVKRTVSCEGATLEKNAYDTWMANDSERIYRHAAVIGDSCASQLLAQLGLAEAEPIPLVIPARK